ncbi:MAG: acyl-CoA dehydrogenase [Actinomycetota bacterium]
MTSYTPPIDDIRFVLEHVVGLDEVLAADRFDGVDGDMVATVVEEVGRFLAEAVAPTNRDGDQIGSVRTDDGRVVTPDSFKAAYDQWVASGFGAMPFNPEYGGGGFPWVSAIAVQEMLTSANMAFSLCSLLTQGAIDALEHHGSPEQQAMYLPKMLTGEWTGTMNLTEPQAGSDVGALTSRAEPVGDGSWKITGQKIYITYGEHDLAENIIHLVLARTPGAPPGTKGISMFLVPKFLVNDDGSLGEHNDVSCVSIEHKLGIHGSPTCVMSYGDDGGAIGWLVGGEGAGMRNMFTMMNNARLSVGLEGLALAERAYQQALGYAQERLQGTAIGAEPGTSSPIIEHPDVRRMLMTQRAWIDAMRYLIYENAAAIDLAGSGGADAEAAQELTDLLIPLSKGLCTDIGCEMTSLAVQVHGGMGYVEETGVAQHFRDIRIAPIYEGTNGIQAADLVGRKLPMRGGAVVGEQLDTIEERAKQLGANAELETFGRVLVDAVAATRRSSEWLLQRAREHPADLLAGSAPYLRMLGTVVCGGLAAKAALVALEQRASAGEQNTEVDGFLHAKLVAAKFFGEQILPTAIALEGAVTAGAGDLYALEPQQL